MKISIAPRFMVLFIERNQKESNLKSPFRMYTMAYFFYELLLCNFYTRGFRIENRLFKCVGTQNILFFTYKLSKTRHETNYFPISPSVWSKITQMCS